MTFAKSFTHGPRHSRITTVTVITIAFSALALAGCREDGQGTRVAGWALVDPEQRHPIMVSQEPSTLHVSVARGSQGLTPQQRAEVVEFTSKYRSSDAGNSRLVVSVPSGAPNEIAAMNAAEDVRQLLVQGGFAESAIAVEAYHEGSSSQPPLRIAYMRYVAKGPDCGNDWSENLATNYDNVGYPNFGCANQHNLAAMIANPADLLGPRTMGDRYADRRDKVMEAYTKGEPTGAKKSEDEKVSVKTDIGR